MKRVLEAIAGGAKAGAAVLKSQRAAERDTLAGLLRNFQTLKRSLENRVLAGVTDFRRFNLQALLADVDRMIAETEAAIHKATAADLQAAADLGEQAANEPAKAVGILMAPSLPGLDADLVMAGFGNTVDLLSIPMKQFGADVKSGIRRVALAGDNKFEEIQALRGKISGAGFDNAQFRAERIIRTEVGRVFNAAQFGRMDALAQSFPFLRKGWRSTKDRRTRTGHREAGSTYARGQGIKIADLFRVNVYDERPGKAPKLIGVASLRYPLDPNTTPAGKLAAGATILCRCSGFVDFSPAELAKFNAERVSLALAGVTPPPVVPPTPIPTPPPVAKVRRLVPKPAPKPKPMKPAQVVATDDPNDPVKVRAKMDAHVKASPLTATIAKLEADLKRLTEDVRQLRAGLEVLSKQLQRDLLKAQGFDLDAGYGKPGGYGSPGFSAASLNASHAAGLDPRLLSGRAVLADTRAAMIRMTAELKATRERLRQELFDAYLKTDPADRLSLSVNWTGKSAQYGNVRAGILAFQEMTGLRTAGVNPNRQLSVNVKMTSLRGKFTPGRDGGTVLTGDNNHTPIHEMGHWLEDTIPGVHEQAVAFLIRRTSGEAATRLKNLIPTGRYGVTERATGDKFLDPYAGKWYSFTQIRGLGNVELKTWDQVVKTVNASEVVSMGLQQMFEDPERFARLDPDYFDFMFKLVRGAAAEAIPKNQWEWNHVDGVKQVPDPSGKVPKLKKTATFVPPGGNP